MKRPITALVFALLPGAILGQQDILYYQFDIGSGDRVFNVAHRSGLAPLLATIETTLPGGVGSSWTTGRTGTALTGGSNLSGAQAYNRINTGFTDGVQGSFSYAMWIKEANDPGTSLSYFISNLGSFRAFTNGVARTGLWTRSWGGSDLKLTTDIQALARSQWTHIALTVDPAGGRAIYYVNGQPEPPIPISAAANIASGGPMYVGMHSSVSTPSTYDLDEFYFTERVLSPTEILILFHATGPLAYTGSYGSGGCNPPASLDAYGGRPSPGTTTYGFRLSCPAGETFAVGVGTSNSQLGGVQLPFDLGTILTGLQGCWLEASQDLAVGVGVMPASGSFRIPLPIPNERSLLGQSVFSQGFVLDPGPPTYRVTQAIHTAFGR